MNRELLDVQAQFKKGRGTRDQIANICWIMEKAGKFHGQRSLGAMVCRVKKESDMTEHTHTHTHTLSLSLFAFKLNKQGDNIQHFPTPFPILNQSVILHLVITVAS